MLQSGATYKQIVIPAGSEVRALTPEGGGRGEGFLLQSRK